MVIRKQGCRDEGETRKGELGEYPEMGVCGKIRGSGKIQGRSIDLWEYGVWECWRRRKYGKEDKVGGQGWSGVPRVF